MVARWLPKASTDEELTQSHLEAAAVGSWPSHSPNSTHSSSSSSPDGAAPRRVVYGFDLPAAEQHEQQQQQGEGFVEGVAVAPEAAAVTAAAEAQGEVSGAAGPDSIESEPPSELFEEVEESTDTADSDLDDDKAAAEAVRGPEEQPAAMAAEAASTVIAAPSAVAAPGAAIPAVAAAGGPVGLFDAPSAPAAAAAADYAAIKAAVVAAASQEADGWIEGYRRVGKPAYIVGGNSLWQQSIAAGPQASSHAAAAGGDDDDDASTAATGLKLHQRVCWASTNAAAAAVVAHSSGISSSGSKRHSSRSGGVTTGSFCTTSSVSPSSSLSFVPRSSPSKGQKLRCTASSAGLVLRRAGAVQGASAATVAAGGIGSICVVKLSGPAAAAAVRAQKQHQAAAAAAARAATAGAEAVSDAAQLSAALVTELRLQVAEWELPVGLRGTGVSAAGQTPCSSACGGGSAGGSKASRVCKGWQWLSKSVGGGVGRGGG